MSEFLEQLKVRMVEAQRRHQLASQKLQIAQQEHATASQDFVSWQNTVRVETLREQQEIAANQGAVTPQQALPTPPQPSVNREELSKTDMIRQLLRQHPEGIRPTELWKQLANQLKHRAYLYSVLKRLKEKQEVCERRGKYFSKVVPRIEEDEEKVHATVQ